MRYANKICYTDIEPYEIIATKGKTMTVRRMRSIKDFTPEFVEGGFSANCVNNAKQVWKITPNEEGEVKIIRQHKNGGWMDSSGDKYRPADVPVRFYDFNF